MKYFIEFLGFLGGFIILVSAALIAIHMAGLPA
jgi:hypothetical protein